MDPSLPQEIATKIAQEDMTKQKLNFPDLFEAKFEDGVWHIVYVSKEKDGQGGPGMHYKIDAYSGDILDSIFVK